MLTEKISLQDILKARKIQNLKKKKKNQQDNSMKKAVSQEYDP
jgi:hypothetical protein